MTAGSYGYGPMRATDADRENVRQIPGTPPQVYQSPPYGAQPFGAQRPTNGMAIAALICGVCQVFFWLLTGIPAIVLGHLARRQIRQTGEAGDGMALTGMILGYIGLALTVLFVVIVVIIAAAVANHHPGPVPGGP